MKSIGFFSSIVIIPSVLGYTFTANDNLSDVLKNKISFTLGQKTKWSIYQFLSFARDTPASTLNASCLAAGGSGENVGCMALLAKTCHLVAAYSWSKPTSLGGTPCYENIPSSFLAIGAPRKEICNKFFYQENTFYTSGGYYTLAGLDRIEAIARPEANAQTEAETFFFELYRFQHMTNKFSVNVLDLLSKPNETSRVNAYPSFYAWFGQVRVPLPGRLVDPIQLSALLASHALLRRDNGTSSLDKRAISSISSSSGGTLLPLCSLDVIADASALKLDMVTSCLNQVVYNCFVVGTRDICRSLYQTAYRNSMYREVEANCAPWNRNPSCGIEVDNVCKTGEGYCTFAKFSRDVLFASQNNGKLYRW